ncbi:MAG: hypothetical protein LBD69_01500 [Puniceicoccales bacterium]|jgi:hypothetical protein|nr:hypothetical protein [Puniceicoccales bacterium]
MDLKIKVCFGRSVLLKICVAFVLCAYSLLNAEDDCKEQSLTTNRVYEELIKNSPFIPAYFSQGGNSVSTLSTLTTADYQFHSVMKIEGGIYHFGLTDVHTHKGIWISSRREDNDPNLHVQFYAYDESKALLVLELPEGLVRIQREVLQTEAKTSAMHVGGIGESMIEDTSGLYDNEDGDWNGEG